ncbi:MAG: hypothetical protein ABW189_00275 [Rickettsiales bacterium]
MKKVKLYALLAMGASAMAMTAAKASYACGAGEVCGLDLYVNDSKFVNIEGAGGVDISGLKVEGAHTIDIVVPGAVKNAMEFSQKNTGKINSELNYYGQFISGKFESQTAAIANNANIQLKGSTAMEAAQDNNQSVTAKANLTLNHLVEIGDIDLNVTSVANSATFGTDGNLILDMAQNNTGAKVDARLDTLLQGQNALADADVSVNVAALGNNLSVTSQDFTSASVSQHNCADISSLAKVTINGMKDPVNVTAMGNSIQIAPVKVQ